MHQTVVDQDEGRSRSQRFEKDAVGSDLRIPGPIELKRGLSRMWPVHERSSAFLSENMAR
jgi:hypothetical protein